MRLRLELGCGCSMSQLACAQGMCSFEEWLAYKTHRDANIASAGIDALPAIPVWLYNTCGEASTALHVWLGLMAMFWWTC